MAVTTAMVLAGVSAATSLVGGIQQKAEAERQANFAEASGILQAEEQVRTSAKEAKAESEAAESHRRKQKLSYLKSGVSLEGSPWLMMEQTRLQGQRNVDEVIGAGASGAAGALSEGRTRAKNYKASGRQAFISGLGKAAGTIGGQF